mgnify:CR=1 FL=1
MSASGLHQHVSSDQQANNDEDHDHEEEEDLEVLRVIRLRNVLDYLAVVSLESFAALALAVEADAAVHALAGAVRNCIAQYPDVRAHILLAANL